MAKWSASAVPRPVGWVLGMAFLSTLALPAAAQLVVGQYEDEAPLSSWNILGAVSPAAWGAGGLRISRAFDAWASTTNPALLADLPSSSLSLGASLLSAELFRFSLVNTGVLSTSSNLPVSSLSWDGAALAGRVAGWTLAATAALVESYGRPLVDFTRSSTYRLRFDQTGALRLWSAAAARRFGRRLAVGLGINYVSGRLDRATIETWPEDGIAITDEKSERLSGLFFNLGVRTELASRLGWSLAVRTPFVKAGDGRSLFRYESSATDVRIEGEGQSRYRQPWVVGTGLEWRPSEGWSLAAEATIFLWSGYEAIVLDDPLPRRFRNVVTAAAGVERLMQGRLGRSAVLFPVRVGVFVDPQPMDDLHSTYYGVTLGTGLRMGRLAVDLAGAAAFESGSGDRLRTGRVSVGLSYVYGRADERGRRP